MCRRIRHQSIPRECWRDQISNRMTSQINGLTQGNRNANDGISMCQVTEGALDEVTNMLQRIRTLAIQSANGTNSSSERTAINEEVEQLKAEISRIGRDTTFGGNLYILGSDLGGVDIRLDPVTPNQRTYPINPNLTNNPIDQIDQQLAWAQLAHSEALDKQNAAMNGRDNALNFATQGNVEQAKQYAMEAEKAAQEAELAKNKANDCANQARSEYEALAALADDDPQKIQAQSNVEQAEAWLNEANVAALNARTYADAAAKAPKAASAAAVAGLPNGGTADAAVAVQVASLADNTDYNVNYQVGSNAYQIVGLNMMSLYSLVTISSAMTVGGNTVASGTNLSNISVQSYSSSQETIAVVSEFIRKVDSYRAEMGAVQNRLEATISNQENVIENVSDARSRIRDVDYAVETANMTQQSIIQQASTTILTQANQKTQIALNLLQG